MKIPEKPKVKTAEDIDNIIKSTPKVTPVKPNQPVQPVKPNQPVQPVKPNQPVQPVNPHQPSQPSVVKKEDEIEDACLIM